VRGDQIATQALGSIGQPQQRLGVVDGAVLAYRARVIHRDGEHDQGRLGDRRIQDYHAADVYLISRGSAAVLFGRLALVGRR
jgi:hypothetical protein